MVFFFFSSRRRHTRWTGDWSSDVCSSDLIEKNAEELVEAEGRNTGKPNHVTMAEEIPPMVDQIRFFAGAARMLEGKSAGERSEERRVGKECRSRWAQEHEKKNEIGKTSAV